MGLPSLTLKYFRLASEDDLFPSLPFLARKRTCEGQHDFGHAAVGGIEVCEAGRV